MLEAKPSIMIASNSKTDAELVYKLLKDDYSEVYISAQPESYTDDFDAHFPDVLILAFKTLDEARAYYQGVLGVSSKIIGSHIHKTILLCQNNDIKSSFELCQAQQFHDYVPFWPVSFDGLRLPMSITQAAKAVLNLRKHEAAMRVIKNAEKSVGSATGRAKGRPLVMMVDDEKFQHKIVKHFVTEMECDYEFAYSAEEALFKLKYSRPDLILMDIVMPGMSGIDLMRQLRDVSGDALVPTIMVSGNSDAELVKRSLKAGAVDFLVKPFSHNLFMNKVSKFLK